MFDTSEWDVEEYNDDHYRPSYVIRNRKKTDLIIKYGPKIEQRAPYDYINWAVMAEGAVEISVGNKKLKNIFVPTVTKLAYSKLISCISRLPSDKGRRDLRDFVDLSNNKGFMVSEFLSVSDRLSAIDYIIRSIPLLKRVISEMEMKSEIIRFTNIFCDKGNMLAEVAGFEGGNAVFARGSSKFIERILDATIYFRDALGFGSDEIVKAIENGTLLPTRSC